MKYSELISFKPIESTIQLLETADKKVAQDMVQTYVMSDTMADNLKAIPVRLYHFYNQHSLPYMHL